MEVEVVADGGGSELGVVDMYHRHSNGMNDSDPLDRKLLELPKNKCVTVLSS
jgi:hypothetical protein